MKKYVLISLLGFLLASNKGYSQELDPSIIENLSPAQIAMARSSLDKTKTSANPTPTVTESTKRVLSPPDINKIAGKYGYSYFSSVPTSISAVGDLPLPNDYRISLKDQFTVILSGSKEAIFDLDVKLDGSILFPELGLISVVGETFMDVKTKLKNLIKQSYIGVQIDISLKNLSAKKITIVGAVKTPGTYLVNPFSTISSALGYSGGISEIGTLRNIRLVRSNGEIFNFDLYKLLIYGDRSYDITIEAGDVIIIDPAYQFINLTGQIKRPAIYEVLEGETFSDLIAFGLGYTNLANKSNLSVNKLDENSRYIVNQTLKDLDAVLKNVVSVNINPYLNKNYASVRVTGAVKEPGFYDLKKYSNLKDLISALDFVDVYPWLAVLEQFDEDNLIKSTTLFNLKDESTYDSVNILPNSKVHFADLDSPSFKSNSLTTKLIDEYKITLNHRGASYKLPVYGFYKVQSFIGYLGLDMSDIDKTATYISPLDNIVINDLYNNMRYKSKKYHTISFRSPVNDLISVSINGAIDYPGTYTLKSDATIEDLYALVGDFKSEAFLDGIIFSRQSVRDRQIGALNKSRNMLSETILIGLQDGQNIEDINLIRSLSKDIEEGNLGRVVGNYSPGSKSSMETVLFNGDAIFVPKNPNIINVLGQVYNAAAFEYKKGLSVQDVINNAGGYKDYAYKRRVYVIKANGLIETTNRNIFTKNINLEPGDTIVVPRKINFKNSTIEALLPATKILSDLAFSAAAIESLSRN